nr:MAG TPA: hypothetical protein [Caudoviricetes sp.]
MNNQEIILRAHQAYLKKRKKKIKKVRLKIEMFLAVFI